MLELITLDRYDDTEKGKERERKRTREKENLLD